MLIALWLLLHIHDYTLGESRLSQVWVWVHVQSVCPMYLYLYLYLCLHSTITPIILILFRSLGIAIVSATNMYTQNTKQIAFNFLASFTYRAYRSQTDSPHRNMWLQYIYIFFYHYNKSTMFSVYNGVHCTHCSFVHSPLPVLFCLWQSKSNLQITHTDTQSLSVVGVRDDDSLHIKQTINYLSFSKDIILYIYILFVYILYIVLLDFIILKCIIYIVLYIFFINTIFN